MQFEILSFGQFPHGHDLTWGDGFVLAAIMIVWPIYSYMSLKRHPVETLRKDPRARLDSYNYTMLQLCCLAISILTAWAFAKRSFTDLGFQHQFNLMTAIAWGVATLGVIFSAVQLYQVKHSQTARKKIRQQLNAVGEYTHLLMPKNHQEYRRAMLVGVTAGITEEIIFRGYLIWAFSVFIHPWLAGAASVAVFVFLHRYQEKAGLIQVALFATAATILYLLCGSLWPVIFLHIGVDVLNISLAWQLDLDH